MKTKEEILERHCAGEHEARSTYLDLDGAIDGRTSHVLFAMEEYAKQMSLQFGEWIRYNCNRIPTGGKFGYWELISELGQPITTEELYDKFLDEYLDAISYT